MWLRIFLAATLPLAGLGCTETKVRYRLQDAPPDYVGELWRFKGGFCQTFSSDGRLLACTGGDFGPSVRILDVDTGRPISSFNGHGDLLWHSMPILYPFITATAILCYPLGAGVYFSAKTNAVSAVAFTPDGRGVLSGGSEDNTLRLWRARCGWPVKTFGELAPQKRGFRSVCIDRSGHRLISVASDNTISEWSMASGKRVWHSKPGKDGVLQALFTPDCAQFVTCDKDGKLDVWDAATREIVRTLDLGTAAYDICISEDGRRMSAATYENLRLWDLASGVAMKRFHPSGYTNSVPEPYASCFRDGRHVLAVVFPDSGPGRLGTHWLVLVDLEREREVQRWDLASYGIKGPPMSIAVSPDGRLAALSGWDEVIHLWKLPKLPAWGEELPPSTEPATRPGVASMQSSR